MESGDNEVIREMRDEFTKIVDELRTELKRVKKVILSFEYRLLY